MAGCLTGLIVNVRFCVSSDTAPRCIAGIYVTSIGQAQLLAGVTFARSLTKSHSQIKVVKDDAELNESHRVISPLPLLFLFTGHV